MSEADDKKAQALRYADQIAKAIGAKLPDYKTYVRLYECAEFNFIEIALIPVKSVGNMDEPTVAYSQMYFEEMSDPEVKQKRAQRIFKDAKIVLGIMENE